VYYNLTANEEIYDLLKNALKTNLDRNGYEVISGNILLASKGNIQVEIDIFKKTIKTVKPEKKKVIPKQYIAKIAIILDDGGNNIELIKRLANLPYKSQCLFYPLHHMIKIC